MNKKESKFKHCIFIFYFIIEKQHLLVGFVVMDGNYDFSYFEYENRKRKGI